MLGEKTTPILPCPIPDILLSPFIFLFFDNFNIFSTFADSYKSQMPPPATMHELTFVTVADSFNT